MKLRAPKEKARAACGAKRRKLTAGDYSDRLLAEGRKQQAAGNVAEALESYLKAYGYATKDEEVMAAVQAMAQAMRRGAGKPVPEGAKDLMRQGMVAMRMAKRPEDFAPAARDMEQGVALAPWWAMGHFNAAVALEGAGSWANAARHLRSYLALDPDAEDKEKVLMKIAALAVRLKEGQQPLSSGEAEQ